MPPTAVRIENPCEGDQLLNCQDNDWSYQVKESKRARRASVRVKVRSGIEVTIPIGYDRSRIPDFLNQHSEWIQHRLERARDVKESLNPDAIRLEALDTTWRVSYIKTPGDKLELRTPGPGRLVLRGHIDDPVRVAERLNLWVHKAAESALIPWLDRESKRLSLPYSQVSIRHQKSRWGSCSARGSINLNQNLIFLSPREVEYVLAHELCHTKELNHSKRFWDLLTSIQPEARSIRKGLRNLNLPIWIWYPLL